VIAFSRAGVRYLFIGVRRARINFKLDGKRASITFGTHADSDAVLGMDTVDERHDLAAKTWLECHSADRRDLVPPLRVRCGNVDSLTALENAKIRKVLGDGRKQLRPRGVSITNHARGRAKDRLAHAALGVPEHPVFLKSPQRRNGGPTALTVNDIEISCLTGIELDGML